jgi:hypothetical protein
VREVGQVLSDAGEELDDVGAKGGGVGVHERAPSGWVAVRVSDRSAVTVLANVSQSLVWVVSWARPDGVIP